jgi:thioredoxin reductase/Pyruvate/2-oxoacid:ferredoxin oxidoreductase delta subunit
VLTIIYFIPLAILLAWHLASRAKKHRHAVQVKQEAVEAGLTEPATLHPVIDAGKCVGCGACVAACPEQPEHHVLGMLKGKAHLIGPTECIGHGACKVACPVGAISLVFGTETRGIDLPVLKPNFESTVPGVFVAGELGGMGLIRNALTQGREAVEYIAKSRKPINGRIDLIIVGGGPAGFAAALTAKSKGMNYLVLEQDGLGGCVYKYPRGKLVMTAPVELPLIGKVYFRQTSKEKLLQFWNKVRLEQSLKINDGEQVIGVLRDGTGFVVRTTKSLYKASSVLLAIGRRGTPRKLEVPGEELPKVVYRLIDPDQYAGQRVLVVGGGDSALEAAASIAEVGGTHVTLSYRGDAFGRAKPRNRQRVNAAQQAGKLNVVLKSNVKSINPDLVILEQGGKQVEVPNASVIVSAGGVLPNEFLKAAGIEVSTKYGTA